MKKLLFMICFLGVSGSVRAMDSEVLYECNGVTITQKDANDFRSGTFTRERFNELHGTISALLPALRCTNYDTYCLAISLDPRRVSAYTDQLLAKFAALKAQGQQVSSTSTTPPVTTAAVPSCTASVTPAISSAQPPKTRPTLTSPAVTTSTIKPPALAAKPVMTKPSAPASQPHTLVTQSTVIFDTKYLLGAAGVVLILILAYKWYEARAEDNENEHSNN